MTESNNGLMKKTKAQLIEIILRKDEVERSCRDEINDLKNRIEKYDFDVRGMMKLSKEDKIIIDKQANMLIEKENLIDDMTSQFDIFATETAEAKESACIYKYYIKVLSIACAVLAVTLMCKLFVF